MSRWGSRGFVSSKRQVPCQFFRDAQTQKNTLGEVRRNLRNVSNKDESTKELLRQSILQKKTRKRSATSEALCLED